MKQQTTHISDEQLDALLNSHHSTQPPADFSARVMQTIDAQPEALKQTAAQPQDAWWQLPAILLAAIPGAAQAITLIFSVWHVTAAG